MKRSQGLTLIELLVVTAVLATITAMAIPSIRNARMAANEGSAITTLRKINLANQSYKVRYRTFTPDLNALYTANIIDDTLASLGSGGIKSGYQFTYNGTVDTWNLSASPETVGNTGNRHFFIDESGVIRHAEGGPANGSSSPIGG